MNTNITRPEKITKFLSHMFTTEKDRLCIELIVELIGIFSNCQYILTKNIQLVSSSISYILKYNSLRDFGITSDKNTPKEIHEDRVVDEDVIVINMTNTTKSLSQQVNYINLLTTASFKINYNQKRRELNSNPYVFIANEKLNLNSDRFKTYCLDDEYDDEEYEFTEDESIEYGRYITNLCNTIRNIHVTTEIQQLDQLIDIYIDGYND